MTESSTKLTEKNLLKNIKLSVLGIGTTLALVFANNTDLSSHQALSSKETADKTQPTQVEKSESKEKNTTLIVLGGLSTCSMILKAAKMLSVLNSLTLNSGRTVFETSSEFLDNISWLMRELPKLLDPSKDKVTVIINLSNIALDLVSNIFMYAKLQAMRQGQDSKDLVVKDIGEMLSMIKNTVKNSQTLKDGSGAMKEASSLLKQEDLNTLSKFLEITTILKGHLKNLIDTHTPKTQQEMIDLSVLVLYLSVVQLFGDLGSYVFNTSRDAYYNYLSTTSKDSPPPESTIPEIMDVGFFAAQTDDTLNSLYGTAQLMTFLTAFCKKNLDRINLQKSQNPNAKNSNDELRNTQESSMSVFKKIISQKL
jgi:hypothetical protein